MKIEWGLHTNSGGDTIQTIYYPTSFTQPPIINITYRRSDSQDVFYYALNINNVTTTSFKVGSHSVFNNNLKYCWMAIGY